MEGDQTDDEFQHWLHHPYAACVCCCCSRFSKGLARWSQASTTTTTTGCSLTLGGDDLSAEVDSLGPSMLVGLIALMAGAFACSVALLALEVAVHKVGLVLTNRRRLGNFTNKFR